MVKDRTLVLIFVLNYVWACYISNGNLHPNNLEMILIIFHLHVNFLLEPYLISGIRRNKKLVVLFTFVWSCWISYGKLHSKNLEEKILVIIVQVLNLLLKSYLISIMIDLRTRKDMGKEDNAESEDMGKEDNVESEDMGKEDNAESEDMGKEDNAEWSCERGYGEGSFLPAAQEGLTPIHELELLAYRIMLKTLNKSGVSYKCAHEFLSKLRDELHISYDEHLVELSALED